MLEAHYGVALAGGVWCLSTSVSRPVKIAYILNHSGAKFLFADSEFGSGRASHPRKSRTLKKVVDILEGRGAKPLGEMDYEAIPRHRQSQPVPWPLRDEEELLSLNYTSGTTANPRG